jgi:hypothetical protein
MDEGHAILLDITRTNLPARRAVPTLRPTPSPWVVRVRLETNDTVGKAKVRQFVSGAGARHWAKAELERRRRTCGRRFGDAGDTRCYTALVEGPGGLVRTAYLWNRCDPVEWDYEDTRWTPGTSDYPDGAA